MDYTDDIKKLTALKAKVAEHEAARAKASAKVETLLEQAKANYNVSSLTELKALLTAKGEERDALGTKVQEMNNKLEAFFTGA